MYQWRCLTRRDHDAQSRHLNAQMMNVFSALDRGDTFETSNPLDRVEFHALGLCIVSEFDRFRDHSARRARAQNLHTLATPCEHLRLSHRDVERIVLQSDG